MIKKKQLTFTFFTFGNFASHLGDLMSVLSFAHLGRSLIVLCPFCEQE